MFCSKCGAASHGGQFCSSCGSQLQVNSSVSPIPLSHSATKPCPFCKEPIHPDAIKCSHCGSELNPRLNFQQPLQDPSQSPNPVPQANGDEALRIFVGGKYDYYKHKWEAVERRRSRQTWNWGAFWVGFVWMAYRKMYLYSCIYIGAVLLAIVWIPDNIFRLFSIATTILVATQSNALYKFYATKKALKITSTNNPEQARLELARQGGTNIGAALVALIAYILITGYNIVIANPELFQ